MVNAPVIPDLSAGGGKCLCERPATSTRNPLTMQFAMFLLLWGSAPRLRTEKQVQGHRLKIQAAGVWGRKLVERETVRLGEGGLFEAVNSTSR